ncbi:MAG: hypothetical protein EXQ71_10950 [Acidimicrobiia bacterium]|nr:hypothetical protein [Acidimicrobiia bacterium]
MSEPALENSARRELSVERSRLESQVASLSQGTGASPDFDDNFADSGQVAAEQGENKLLAAELRNELDEVERALAKLDEGVYGSCETCGTPVGADRLEAMPATRFCIDHA